jgi:membrane protease subunit (stomatin/prohibitin family)
MPCGMVFTVGMTNTRTRSYCTNCDEVQRYTAHPAHGEWECDACGCPIECVECGHTMDDGHECGSGGCCS